MRKITVSEVYKIFTKKPALVSEETSIEDVINELLKDPASRSVYVVNKDNKLSGIITTTVLLKTTHFLKGKQTLRKEDSLNAYKIISAKYAKDIAHPPVFVYEDTDIIDALEKMIDENIQELPIINREKKVIGDLNCLELLKILWEN